ncbi:nucleotidyltransferase [Chitinophaga agrisoli]|uniref:Nucleotidyltransferase n=1 Tax=Chitinophaga agrisoli TaxID=2607653 RepID=A0A5B2W2Z9_9BACT|nr:nucleotidyltransferase [Chitinophaga agrisoli]KAA2245484.1 nucleotidyltransferase [Chitinophaga agrisoli]
MARSVQEIQQTITATYVTEMAAIGIVVDPITWSRVNLVRLFIFIFSAAAFVLESIFDALRTEIENIINALKPHTLRWYVSKVMAYQHGFNLLPDSDKYDNTGFTDSDIEAAKVVKYAAVVEQTNEFGRVFLRIKAAAESGGDLTPLSAEQLGGLKEYVARVKDAGVGAQVDSLPADSLKMQWTVYYDPLLLNSQGGRLDGTDSNPVGNAIRQYLSELPFNGLYVLSYHTDAVQAVEGVVIAVINTAQTKYGDLPYQSVDVLYNPDAGYLRIYQDTDLLINYLPHSAIK